MKKLNWKLYCQWVWIFLAITLTAYIVYVSKTKMIFKTSRSVLKLFILVGAACFIGAVFEYKAWSRFASFLATPLIRLGKLPKVSGVAFLTAIFSNNAANTLVASSYSESKMTRKEMIISGLCNSYPAMVSHSLRILFPLFSAIGMAAIWYYSITFGTGLFMTVAFLLFSRRRESVSEDQNSIVNQKNHKQLTWKTILKKSLKRTYGVLKRLLIITTPIYFFVAYLSAKGVFNVWKEAMPEGIRSWLSPEIMAVLAARLGGLVNAGSVASEFLQQHKIEIWQIVLAFLIGNVITNPIRSIRRNLPSALGIFPGRDGLLIVLILQTGRLIFSLLAIFLILKWYT